MRSPEARRRLKYAAYCRAAGVPLLITDDEQRQLLRQVMRLYNRGMSDADIAEAAGPDLNHTAIGKIRLGTVQNSRRSTFDALMKTPYIPPTGFRKGRKMDSAGMKRRLQALAANGFGPTLLAPMLGVSLQAVHQLTISDRPAYASTYGRIVQLYDKLEMADPADYGATPTMIVRAKNAAKRRGYAPAHVWDPDTIDDPEAFPEWTGMCGTAEGARIHVRERIPACPQCAGFSASAMHIDRLQLARSFDGAKFKAARLAKKLSQREVEIASGLSLGQIHHWESGRHTPRDKYLVKALEFLEIGFEDVRKEE